MAQSTRSRDGGIRPRAHHSRKPGSRPENRNSYLETGHTYRLDWDGHEFETHGTEAIVEPAEDFLLSDPGSPWLCTVTFHAPHEPFDPPPSFDTYDPDDVAVPPNFMPEHPFDNGDLANRDEFTETWPRTPEMVRDIRARYYGQISHLDHAVGRLLTALERTGQREDTVVVFTSDHGLAVGSHDLLDALRAWSAEKGDPVDVPDAVPVTVGS